MTLHTERIYRVTIKVNDQPYEVGVGAGETLREVLRDRLGFTSVKHGCESGACGACTVILEGRAVQSCLLLAVEADGKSILTLEGLSSSDGQLHPLQRAFVESGATQCGFCTPGMIMTAKALLDEKSAPTTEEIKEAMQGNLCRCTGYIKIIEAIKSLASGR
ncbi:(2Fe-2S)-binding protein [Chloroflexota bacterium]